MAVNIAYVHGVGGIGGAEKDLLAYIDLLAVSYTHLTLPTNREV